MKLVSVTGHNGFVGSNLIPYLMNQNFEVTGVGRRTIPDAEYQQIAYDELPLHKCEALIHLAGKAHDLKGSGSSAEYFEVNTELTKNIFNTFLQSDATVFIYISSVKAAADSIEGILYEDVEARPLTAYGQSKLMAEEFLLHRILPKGKRVYVLRPCMIHGPGNKGNLNLLLQVIKKSLPYPLAAFENKRSLLSIQNLLFTINALINDSQIASGIYNIADDEPLSTNEIVDALGEALNKKAVKWRINPGLIRILASIGDRFPLPLNSDKLQKLTESFVVNNDKIKKAMSITNFSISSKEGLTYTALNI
ncbi:NAD-dependent epimerase/dehydratase family protein [Pedobacter psychroterrae]|uniref:NAD-dependent epimerase/dehydratase family protein n=1 Tax=Pedobacter psychroterrae TaxID=2530453 RepID=A0A4R0N9F5_9SPHI|nr:NAD-dependent epimerase/dehydratase family protein [Pedobacter psychroterrae]TCC96821.1 NAD-dependent epimerase/dehydratase family protein [Pedobacter psychroterrae]